MLLLYINVQASMQDVSRFVVCCDSFKGCMSSTDVNAVVEQALRQSAFEGEVRCITVSDGGEGFLEAVAANTAAQWHTATVHDPLMRPVAARYVTIGRHTAVIESAQACGLTLLRPHELNPLRATSYGLGELIVAALRHDVHHIIIGMGGTATCDYGAGMLRALHDGLSADGSVESLHRMLGRLSFTIATDVDNPLLGPRGAAAVFAPQKGATPDMIPLLEQRGKQVVAQAGKLMGRDCSSLPGAGAAGGLAYACMQYLDAKDVKGIDAILDSAGFDAMLTPHTCVITGEGRADEQTLMGKVPYGVLCRAKMAGARTWLIAGQVANRELLLQEGFDMVADINADIHKSADATTASAPHLCKHADLLSPAVAQRNIRRTVSRLCSGSI